MNVLSDPSAEQYVLAGIIHHGKTIYYDILTKKITEDSFVDETNACIFKCIKSKIERDDTEKLDLPTLLNEAKVLGYEFVFNHDENVDYLKSLFDIPILEDNVASLASKIKKIEIARNLHNKLDKCKQELKQVTGTESINDILATVETNLFNQISLIVSDSDEPSSMGEDIENFVKDLAENKVEQIGISTGFPLYDHCMGGGLRNGSVYVVGARTSVGKSIFLLNVGYNISEDLKIPVLYMDTEMQKNEQMYRYIALNSEVPIREIESGQFSSSPESLRRVKEATERMRDSQMHHKNIAGTSFETQLSIMKKWIIKTVGMNKDGTSKPCVILYDYLKLMNSDDIKSAQEYQLLGFMMTQLQNFGAKYNIPIVATVQLNRDGAKDNNDLSVISQSDRISWLAAGVAILRKKSEEEMAQEGSTQGNRKLIPLKTRFGEPLDGKHINIDMIGKFSKMKELDIARSTPAPSQPSRSNNNKSGDGQSSVTFEL